MRQQKQKLGMSPGGTSSSLVVVLRACPKGDRRSAMGVASAREASTSGSQGRISRCRHADGEAKQGEGHGERMFLFVPLSPFSHSLLFLSTTQRESLGGCRGRSKALSSRSLEVEGEMILSSFARRNGNTRGCFVFSHNGGGHRDRHVQLVLHSCVCVCVRM